MFFLKRPKPFLGLQVYAFTDPDTFFKFKAPSLEALCAHIRRYREQNGLPPIEFLEDVVINYCCGLKANLGVCEEYPYPLKRGVFHYIKGGMSLLQNVLYDRMVSQEEADRRAKICTNCPHNVFPDKGAFIKWSDRLAEASTGGKRSAHHNELGNCAVCTCPLRAKVWAVPPFGNSEEENKALPDFCWQKKKQ